jgi:hypothetical protein
MRSQAFRQPISRPKVQLDIETHPLYWNPNRIGAIQAPAWFMDQVGGISKDLDVRRNAVTSKWEVWVRSPRFIHPICQGWRLLFIHHDTQGQVMPLDERLLGRLHYIDTQNSSAKAYFDRVVAEIARDKAAQVKARDQETMDMAIERGWDHSRIQVSMRGPSNGSKFSTYHA